MRGRYWITNDGELHEITKVDEAEHLVFGFFNLSVRSDGHLISDLQGHTIPPGELEGAAYEFVRDVRKGGSMHEGGAHATLVESMVFTPEKNQLLGLPDDFPIGWWGGFHVPDPVEFAKVVSGEYRMFSIEGEAVLEPIEVGE